MVDEATIAEALMKTPECLTLGDNPNGLRHYKVNTKADLVNLVQHLTSVTRREADEWIKGSFPPNILNKAVFQVNGQFYYLEVRALFNIPGDHYSINIRLYRHLNNSVDNLEPLLIWEEVKGSLYVPFPFDYLVESLKEDLEEEQPSSPDTPDNVQHSPRLKRPESPEDVEQQVTYYTYFER